MRTLSINSVGPIERRAVQILTGAYLAIVLLTWPILVALWKWLFCENWLTANRGAWRRWNQIRRDPYQL